MTRSELINGLKIQASVIKTECKYADVKTEADRKSLMILGIIYSNKCIELMSQLKDYEQALKDLTK